MVKQGMCQRLSGVTQVTLVVVGRTFAGLTSILGVVPKQNGEIYQIQVYPLNQT